MIAAVAPAPDARAQPPRAKPSRDDHFAGAMKDASAPADGADPKASDETAADKADKPATIAPGASPAAPDAAALAAAQALLAAAAKARPAPAAAGAAPAVSSTRAPLHAGAIKDGVAADADAAADITAMPAMSFADAQRMMAALTGETDMIATQATGAAAAPAEATLAHHLDLAKDSGWLDGLARDIARSADAGGHLRFTLAPEHLGKLDVQLAAAADGTAIRLTTETREAHRIIADAQPRLVAEARAQGLRVSETQVDLDHRHGGRSQGFGNQDGGGGRSRRQAAWFGPGAIAPAAPAAGAGNDDLYA